MEDPTGQRRSPGESGADEPFLRRHQEGLVYLLAAVTYVAASLLWRPLLNWIVGPAWLVAWVWLAPPLLDRRRS